MSVLNENTIIGASGASGDYEIEQSLRFNDNDTASLSRTPSVAGNQKTWTLSCWVKRGDLANQGTIFEAATAGNVNTIFYLYGTTLYLTGSTSTYDFVLSQVFRDASAWYHLMIAMDTTQSTASNRTKIYINGSIVTAFATETYPSLNLNTTVNSTIAHSLGKRAYDTSLPWDGYMAEVNFIDGQALTPDSFGETGTYGEWKPIEYAGTYGTNGFYLPFKQDYTVEGFSTVVYEGKGVGQYIGGAGFSPSLVWTKARNQTYDHHLFDVIRGPLKRISSNSTSAESSMTNSLTAFNTDGFTLGDTAQVNLNGGEFVAWNWDMGGTTASNTSGSITSSVRANTTYGQSIVSYTGTGSSSNSDTVGHGLSQKPDLYILKNRTASNSWIVRTDIIDGSSDFLLLDGTAAKSDSGVNYADSSVFSLGASVGDNGSGNAHIAYCFHSVTGYSKFGSYSGNGNSTGPVVTTGFSPAFVMIKGTSASRSWVMYDNTRQPSNPKDLRVLADSSDAEFDGNEYIDFTSTGFQIKYSGTLTNASGETYIYAAFADTREYAYWLDQSGNNNDWTSEGGLTESDVMVDSPTNNFATFNPLDNGGNTLSEGNLVLNVSSGFKLTRSTFFADSGKWYWEILCTDSGNGFVGVSTAAESLTSRGSETSSSVNIATSDGDSRTGAATSSYGSAFSDGDIMMLALDMDNGKFYAGKNGTWFNSGNPATSANPAKTGLTTALSPSISLYDNEDYNANFGQDSSFAGAKTPQGYQDANGIGDFYYAPPTGYLALCTSNLPSVDVIPSEHFNTVLYTGDGASSHAITDVGFQPDLNWIKPRNVVGGHLLTDVIRGATERLQSHTTNAEATDSTGLLSFDGNGFTIGSNVNYNTSGNTFAAWNWKAGGSAVSNTNGSITSSVSANVDAGFSIVSYTGTGSAATVGHGLASTPTMIIVKNRSVTNPWWVYTETLGAGKQLRLNDTNAEGSDGGVIWNNTAPTSSVFSVNTNTGSNGSGNSLIAYCFHSVESYSKVGSFVGTGGSYGVVDGAFINLGFRPAMILVKSTGTADWNIFDNRRSGYNSSSYILLPNSSAAEDASNPIFLDLLSNGFKWRFTNADFNASGVEYIFYAVAESPFKHTNAR